MNYKRLTPCIFIQDGMAVTWFDDANIVSEDVVALAKHYAERGADELIVFDLSDTDLQHQKALEWMQQIHQTISIPMIAGGNIRNIEDVRGILQTGAKRAILNFSKTSSITLIEEVSKEYDKKKIAVSLNDFDALFKHRHLIETYSTEIIFMHRLDLSSVMNVTKMPCVVVTDTSEEKEILKILKCNGIKGVSGKYISQTDMDFHSFKHICAREQIKMTAFESVINFSEFQLASKQRIPVIVQDYKSNEIQTTVYLDEETFDLTIKTGKLHFYEAQEQGSKEESYVKSNLLIKTISVNRDFTMLLARTEEVEPVLEKELDFESFQPIVGGDYETKNLHQIFHSMYTQLQEEKQQVRNHEHPNYLSEKGIDSILKKLGTESMDLVLAAKNASIEDLKGSISDLLYQTMRLMIARGLTWDDIICELANRSFDHPTLF
jgi:phosphoribosyl-ATP pyrophosphohydrolase/phosphoribosyl-AMP cyclohydrolase